MNKVYGSAAEALDGALHDGMTIAAGGFGLCGIPELLIAAIRDAVTSFRLQDRINSGRGAVRPYSVLSSRSHSVFSLKRF